MICIMTFFILKLAHTFIVCPVKTAVIPACLIDLVDIWDKTVSFSSTCFLVLNEVTTINQRQRKLVNLHIRFICVMDVDRCQLEIFNG